MVFDTIQCMVYNAIMKAERIFYFKHRQGEVIVEMVIWQLPKTSDERPHGLKYRLFCGTPSECFVRYDNETGKGDHVHYGDDEKDYPFDSVEKLIEDFQSDCSRFADWSWE